MEEFKVPKGDYLICLECETRVAKPKDDLHIYPNEVFLESLHNQEDIKIMKTVTCYYCGNDIDISCAENYQEFVNEISEDLQDDISEGDDGRKVIITVEDIKIEVPVESEEDYIVKAAKKLSQTGITIERGLRESINFELRRD